MDVPPRRVGRLDGVVIGMVVFGATVLLAHDAARGKAPDPESNEMLNQDIKGEPTFCVVPSLSSCPRSGLSILHCVFPEMKQFNVSAAR